MQVSQTYGSRRPREIAARLSAVRAFIAAQPVLALVPASKAKAPALCGCGKRPTFFLCDESGKPLSRRCGGFCALCAPSQLSEVTTPHFGVPAPLCTIEEAGRHADIAQEERAMHLLWLCDLSQEREQLRRDLETMLDADDYGPGPSWCEVEAARARLAELDELLVLAPADLERPFILGFDDLPASYFVAQELACELACAPETFAPQALPLAA